MTDKRYTQYKTIYMYIKNYEKIHKYAPSYDEIGKHMCMNSKSTVHKVIQEMLSLGMLETDTEEGNLYPRAIRVGKLRQISFYF